MSTGAGMPWWLCPGGQTCEFCLQDYAYEREYRCVGCDGAVCPGCVERDDDEIVCPACVAERTAE